MADIEKSGLGRLSADRKDASSGEEGPEELETLAATELEYVELSDEEKKKVLRKLDWILVPQLATLYLLAFLDRGNIGNAKIAGMAKDLKLVGLDYNIALSVFFVTYSLFEVPSNIVLKLVSPSLWLCLIMVGWGIVMTLMGVVQSKGGLYAARFCLGICEAGLFPGATYLLTLWYRRYEVIKRLAIFYAGASLSGAFSGLLAYGIEKMDGVGGYAGWRWIFILEGLLTVVVGSFIWYTLPDSPQKAKFLTPQQRQFIISRLQVETGSGHGRVTNEDPLQKRFIYAGLKEWKIWLAVIAWWGNSITIYGFTYTVPTVITQLGYTAANAQLLTIPIYVCACIVTIIFAWLSDHYQQRAYFIMGGFTLGSLGFLALLVTPHPRLPGLTYGLLFPAATGIYCPLMPLLTWIANNLSPSSKRAVGMALLISLGNLGGGLVGSNIFLDSTKPHYYPGYAVCMGIMAAAVVVAVILRIAYKRLNDQRERMSEEEIRATHTEEELIAMGDLSPYFRYAL